MQDTTIIHIKYSPDNGTKWEDNHICWMECIHYDDLDDYITQSIIQNEDKPSSSKGNQSIFCAFIL